MSYQLVFLGTAPFGFPVLKSLSRDEELTVKGVFTQPDRSSGRGRETQSPPVARYARELNLPLFQPEDINQDGLDKLRELGELDFGIVIAYGQILEKPVLDHPENGFFNFHASLLPRWRGAAPIRHALLNGDDETGVTVFRVEEELDTGPVCVELTLPIRNRDTYGSLYDRLSQVNVGALNVLKSDMDSERLQCVPQQGNPTYASKITSGDARIDWTREADEIERFVRAFCPDPGAFTELGGNRLKIFEAETVEEESSSDPGEILRASNQEIVVQTGGGQLTLLEVQPAGSQRMHVEDFLLGNPDLTTGDQFSS